MQLTVWPAKDPDETVVRYVDWREHPEWIDGDVLTSATATLSTAAGMNTPTVSHDYIHLSRVTLTGGTANSIGKVLNSVTTYAGQTLQMTARIKIEDR